MVRPALKLITGDLRLLTSLMTSLICFHLSPGFNPSPILGLEPGPISVKHAENVRQLPGSPGNPGGYPSSLVALTLNFLVFVLVKFFQLPKE